MYADGELYSGAEAMICHAARGPRESGRFDVIAAAPSPNDDLRRELESAIRRSLSRDVPAQPLTLAAFHHYASRRTRTVRRAVFEALAAGTPGTASAVDGIKDVWPEERVVSAGDPVALARSLDSLLESGREENEARFEQGRRRAKAAITKMTAGDVAVIFEEFAHG